MLLLMTSILHISDPHFETEVMRRLRHLARFHADCDVVALTGDCTSSSNRQLPDEWNEWPQRLKLAMPGNHDDLNTFDLLHGWRWLPKWEYGRERHPPLVHRLNDLLFVGVDTSDKRRPYAELEADLDKIKQTEAADTSAVVLLTHIWPCWGEAEEMGEILRGFIGNRSLLVLHGHWHNGNSKGSEWEAAAKIGGVTYYRSKAISCKGPKRGRGHLITWGNSQFTCSEVQGEW
jgi:predicted phosphodiesterase